MSKIRLAIVGSGPSGMYTAKYFLKMYPDSSIDILEALPTPFGLARYGVACDHESTKNVCNDFQRVLEDERVRFFGNVKVGKNISLDDVRKLYSAVVLSYGCSKDRKLGIPGEDLEGIHAARSFVNFYNGYPSFEHNMKLKEAKKVVIIGQGNVAIDVARILTKNTVSLATTDISSKALTCLSQCNVNSVQIVSRRGAIDAPFTTKEFRELCTSNDVSCTVDPVEIELSRNSSSLDLLKTDRIKARRFELLEKLSHQAEEQKKEIKFRFLLEPFKFLPDMANPRTVGAIVFKRKFLDGRESEEEIILPCNTVFRSIGYIPEEISGITTENGIVKNMLGKVNNGLYVTGWLKRGAKGIIGSNITDAQETLATLSSDIKDNLVNFCEAVDLNSVLNKNGVLVVDGIGWNKINDYEVSQGKKASKTREKILTVEEMIRISKKI